MQVTECLQELNITPTVISQSDNSQPVSLLCDRVLDNFPDSVPSTAGVVSWSPPQPNWSPWTNCNIDEGPLASATLEELSEQLNLQHSDRLRNDQDLLRSIRDREQLPVHSMRKEIMEAINENPVIIIRGNTGCGMCFYLGIG